MLPVIIILICALSTALVCFLTVCFFFACGTSGVFIHRDVRLLLHDVRHMAMETRASGPSHPAVVCQHHVCSALRLVTADLSEKSVKYSPSASTRTIVVKLYDTTTTTTKICDGL